MALLVLVVLLLGIMPALLYLVGWGVKRYMDQTPVWINFPPPHKLPSKKPDGGTQARAQA